MKSLIIDDERLARDELRRLLSAHPEIEILGEAANATEALARIAELKPELLFLDISMPSRTGFDLLEALPPPHPLVIFTTAHDEHALRAFEVNALDYLLKPIHPKRLASALERLAPPDSASALPSTAAPLSAESRIFVKDGERCWFVPLKNLRLLEADGKHTRLHFDAHAPLLFRSLSSLEERLPANLFLRANRNQLVNLDWIERVEPWFSGTLRAVLRSGETIELSRRQSQHFRDQLGL